MTTYKYIALTERAFDIHVLLISLISETNIILLSNA